MSEVLFIVALRYSYKQAELIAFSGLYWKSASYSVNMKEKGSEAALQVRMSQIPGYGTHSLLLLLLLLGPPRRHAGLFFSHTVTDGETDYFLSEHGF